MPYQSGRNIHVVIKQEEVFGQLPGPFGGTVFRPNPSPGLNLGIEAIRSNESRRDGQTTRGRHGSRSVTGQYAADLSVGSYDMLIEAALRGSFDDGLEIDEDAMAGAELVVGADTIEADAGSWIDAGVRVGDVIRLGAGFAAGNRDRNIRVTGLTADTITVAEALEIEAGPISAFEIARPRKVAQGLVARSFAVEEHEADIDRSELWTGVRVGGMQLQLQPSGMALLTFPMVGQDMQIGIGGDDGHYFESPAETASIGLTAVEAKIRLGDTDVADITALDITVGLNAAGQPVIGSNLTPDVFTNLATVEGSVTMLKADASRMRQYLDEAELSLHLTFVEPGGGEAEFCAFSLTNLTFAAGTKSDLGNDGARTQTFQLLIGKDLRGGAYAPTMISYQTSAPEGGGTILLSTYDVDDDAEAGDVAAVLSVIAPGGATGWAYTLLDDAEGRFVIDGDRLLADGALDHETTPSVEIFVSATDGARVINGRMTLYINAPLAALPLSTGAKVMAVGHSFVGNSGYTTVYSGSPTPRIDTVTAVWLGTIGPLRNVDNRFDADTWYDPAVPTAGSSLARFAGAQAGRGGEHMPSTLARLPWCIARRPDVILLDIGSNDIDSSGEPLPVLIARYEALLRPIRNAGIRCVCLLPLDRTTWPPGDPRHAISKGLSDYILSVDGRDGVTVVDDRAALAAATGAGVTISNDGVHLSVGGQWVRYSIMLPILQGMVSAGDFYSRDFTSGNLSPLGAFPGTSGTKSGVTGDVATGLTATRGSGQADVIVASKEAIVGGDRQIFTITPATNANGSRVCTLTLTWPNMVFSSLGLAVGDWVEAGFDYELSQSSDWLGLELILEANTTGNTLRYAATGGMVVPSNTSLDGPHLTGPLVGRATIPRFKLLGTDDIAATADYFRTSLRPVRLSWKKSSTDTLVAKISPIIIRKSTDPRPDWEL